MITFEKPLLKIEEKSDNYSKIVIEPLERGFGITLGNALRRILLSSIPGAAISSLKIEGVMHEFSSVPGIVEDVTHIIINLKKIILKMKKNDTAIMELKANKEGEIKAKDLIYDNNIIEIINPDQHIATISKGGTLNMVIEVTKGRGYVRSEQFTDKIIGTIPIDAIYTPVKKVVYNVETRVSDKAYDRLNMKIETNGSISPSKSFAIASKILMQHLESLVDLDKDANELNFLKKDDARESKKEVNYITMTDLDLSSRSIKSLQQDNINTVEELLAYSIDDLLKIKNLGKKSVEEIITKLKEHGYELKS